MIESGKIVNERSKINIKNSHQTKLMNLIIKPTKNELFVHPPSLTSKTAKKITKYEERKNIIVDGISQSSQTQVQNMKKEVLLKEVENYDKNKNKEIDVSNEQKKKQNEKNPIDLLQDANKELSKSKTENPKSKGDNKVNEKQAHKDAIVPKLLDNNKTSKYISKKENIEELNNESLETGIKRANDEQKMEEKVNSPKKTKTFNKNYRIYEEKEGFKYEHLNYRPVLNVPFSKTREILHSTIPIKKDKYEDIKNILQNKELANEEINRCKDILSILKSKDFLSLQEGLFSYLNLDDITKVILV